jgi:hypothetical protein
MMFIIPIPPTMSEIPAIADKVQVRSWLVELMVEISSAWVLTEKSLLPSTGICAVFLISPKPDL